MERTLDETRARLRARGIQIEPETMFRLVWEALERLPSGLYRDPKRDLTPAEVQALQDGGFELDDEEMGDGDPLARTAAEYSALIEDSLTTSQAASRLAVEASRVRQRLTGQPPTLYGIRMESGWRIPRFQFEGQKPLPGIGRVIQALDPTLHPISVYRWFTSENTDLEDGNGHRLSPRDWLRLGFEPATVATLAADL